MTNYRKNLLNKVIKQLKILGLEDNAGNPRIPPTVSEPTNPVDGFETPVWQVVPRPVRASDDVHSGLTPSIYVSFEGGRLDPTTDTYLENKVERVAFRVEVLLNSNRGAPDDLDSSKVKSLSHQTASCLKDFDELLNFDAFKTLYEGDEIANRTNESTHVIDANIVEWGFDPNNRGTPTEILVVLFEVTISVPRNPTFTTM